MSKSRNKSISDCIKLKQIFISINHLKLAASVALLPPYSIISNFLTPNKRICDTNHTQTNLSNIDKQQLRTKLIAILIAMTWIKLLPKAIRGTIVLHLFVRAVYDLIKLYKYDTEYKVLPSIPHDEIFIGAASLTTVGYAIYHNPWIFDKEFYQFILKWGSNTHEQIGNVFRSKTDPLSSVELIHAYSYTLLYFMFNTNSMQTKVRLQGEKFVECVPEWHSDPSCLLFHIRILAEV